MPNCLDRYGALSGTPDWRARAPAPYGYRSTDSQGKIYKKAPLVREIEVPCQGGKTNVGRERFRLPAHLSNADLGSAHGEFYFSASQPRELHGLVHGGSFFAPPPAASLAARHTARTAISSGSSPRISARDA